MPRVVGIDPGSRFTGFGVVDFTVGARQVRLVAAGRLALKGADLPARLGVLHSELTALLDEYKPEHAAVEQVFVKHYPAAALKLGYARGVALAALAQRALPIAEYAPRLIKKNIVGTGRADKAQVAHMVKHLLQVQAAMAEDTSDALAVALCHAYSVRVAV